VPTAIKLQAEYSDILQVIFVESQGAKPADGERFVLDQKWLGTQAMWTTEPPFSTGGNGLPSCALLSADGTVLLAGSNYAIGGKLEDELEAFAKARKKFPKDLPKDLKKAWTYALKGKLADAVAELDELEAEGGEAATAAVTYRARLKEGVESRFTAITWMLENGFPLEATAAVEQLAAEVEDHADWSDRCSELVLRLESEAMEPELEAAEALAKLESKLFEEGRDEKLAKKLLKLAESHSGTKVAERARHWADLAG
jgi:tetratricopeptide (TPR) repeat protein